MPERTRFTIAQISDLHFGEHRHDRHLAEQCLQRIEQASPDLVLVAGDLTGDGYPEQYEAALAFLGKLPQPWFVAPGNHDERNVGWRTYERLIGSRWQVHDVPFGVATEQRRCDLLRLVVCDSAEPDLDTGELGRVRHGWIHEQLAGKEDAFRVIMLHHHLVAVPATGRERNTLADAGDVLELLADEGVDLVVAGHKHVPHVWTVSGVPIVMSGTATTWRIRGEIPPSFNLIEVTPTEVSVRIIDTKDGAEQVHILPRRQ